MTSATAFAFLNGKSDTLRSFPASPAVIFRFPTWHVVSAPFGKAAIRSFGVLTGNFAPLSAPAICAWICSFTDGSLPIIPEISPAAFAIEQSALWVPHPKQAPLIALRDSSAFTFDTSFPVCFHVGIFFTDHWSGY